MIKFNSIYQFLYAIKLYFIRCIFISSPNIKDIKHLNIPSCGLFKDNNQIWWKLNLVGINFDGYPHEDSARRNSF